MSETNLYKAYTDDTVLNSNPLGLVIALYEGAIDSIAIAKSCFENGDIAARGKAVNKTVGILTELMTSLDRKKGGDVSVNLGRLYDYMQRRVLAAHIQKKPEFLVEVEKLLATLLDGWKQAGKQYNPYTQFASGNELVRFEPALAARSDYDATPETVPYGNYFADYTELQGSEAYSF